MNPIVRSVLAVVLGLAAGIVIIAVAEQINSRIYPLPAGVDPTDLEALKKVIANMPLGALINVLLGWALATIAGSWVAARFGRRAPAAHGLIVGGLLMAAAIANMVFLPHPAWFWAVAAVMFLPLAWLGSRMAAGQTARA